MTQDFTQLDLVRLVYNETNDFESRTIRSEMKGNWSMKEEYKELMAAKKALPKVTFSPSNEVLNSILQYSQSTALETSVG